MDLANQCDATDIGGGSLAHNQATKTIAATSTAAIAQSAASHSLHRTWSVSIVDIDTYPTSRTPEPDFGSDRASSQTKGRIRAVLESSYPSAKPPFLIAYDALSICCVILQRCAINFVDLPVERFKFWTAAAPISFPGQLLCHFWWGWQH